MVIAQQHLKKTKNVCHVFSYCIYGIFQCFCWFLQGTKSTSRLGSIRATDSDFAFSRHAVPLAHKHTCYIEALCDPHVTQPRLSVRICPFVAITLSSYSRRRTSDSLKEVAARLVHLKKFRCH